MSDAQNSKIPLSGLDVETALRTILEGTANETGERFFAALVQTLAKALNTHGAWVTEYVRESRKLRALAFWMGGQRIQNYETDIANTPCEQVIDGSRLVHFPDQLGKVFPKDPEIREAGVVSYLGMPLLDIDGTVLGHLAIIDRRPMPEEPRALALFRIFAARAAAELQRLRAEKQVREREEKLSRIVNSAMDAIVELNDEMIVTHINPAGERVFQCQADAIIHHDLAHYLLKESREKLTELVQELAARRDGQRSLWIAGGLKACRADGSEVAAEATLSRSEMQGQAFYTLILRNVNARLEAEKKINSLTAQAEYLREQLMTIGGFDRIVGQSQALNEVLRDIEQVAGTDTTVLILGETGTGKELIARAIHAASRRQDKPLITVNCAAIPAALMESEFFGHEKGAFTGATQKREGRFALADHGTIFLDEVGELSLDLQAKLLRVLQEGEFTPVGASQLRKVDVRVIAATNRDLSKDIRDGSFRQDLYYRLYVFPIRVPPLRERREDIPLLATAFAAKFARGIGKQLQPLSADCRERLMAYAWPGNVRELQNVIERAVITARDGQLNLDRALPLSDDESKVQPEPAVESSRARILKLQDLEELQRDNIRRALESCNWRVAGKDGAAALLGINPSTLNSRMRALKIQRPE